MAEVLTSFQAPNVIVDVVGEVIELNVIAPQGPPGPPGEQGPPGESIVGPQGADGRSVLSGSGSPSGSLGLDNDFYIDRTAWVIYGPKTGGVWPGGVALIGADGAPGA